MRPTASAMRPPRSHNPSGRDAQTRQERLLARRDAECWGSSGFPPGAMPGGRDPPVRAGRSSFNKRPARRGCCAHTTLPGAMPNKTGAAAQRPLARCDAECGGPTGFPHLVRCQEAGTSLLEQEGAASTNGQRDAAAALIQPFRARRPSKTGSDPRSVRRRVLGPVGFPSPARCRKGGTRLHEQ
jgi:hypothetical protein